MKIDAIDENSILVELSKEDLLKSEVTYEQLDYANEETRRLVRLVLEKVRLETGRMISDGASLEVDVMPDSFGGCLMIFKEKERPKAEEKSSFAFFTEEINDLIDLARRFKKENTVLEKSELYRLEKTFVLFAAGLSSAQNVTVSEYLEPLNLTESKTLRIKEMGECLIKSCALKVLSQ